MISDPVTPDQRDEVGRRIARQRGFMETSIFRKEIFGRGMQVREVATAAAGYPDFPAGGVVSFKDDDRSAEFTGFDGAHQAGGAGTDDDDVSRLWPQGLLLTPPSSPPGRLRASTTPYK